MKNWRNFLIQAGIALALVGSYVVWRSIHSGPEAALPNVQSSYSGTLLNDHEPLPNFSLQTAGSKFGNSDIAGHWTFIFFGYTQCPDVCPTALSILKELKTRLAAEKASLPKIVFVSVDPRRDSLELLSNFTSAFDPSFVGVTGSDEMLAPLVKHLGVFYQRNDQQDAKHYSVDHTAAIYLIDPQGRLKMVFGPPQDVAGMMRDYLALIR